MQVVCCAESGFSPENYYYKMDLRGAAVTGCVRWLRRKGFPYGKAIVLIYERTLS